MKTHNIVIIGGGSAGWMTAATLIRAFPNKKITLIESPNISTVGVGESTIGGIRRWTRFIGLDEKLFFKQTDASIKLSIKFTNFYKNNGQSFFYPFGSPVTDESRNPFEDWHLKKYLYPDTDINDFVASLFPSYHLFTKNKFSLNENKEFDNFNPDDDVAYHFDASKFAIWLKDNFCIPNGVFYIPSEVQRIDVGEDGIENIILDNGSEISADLFIDCTGFKSLLLGNTLKEKFISYSSMLPNDSAWATRVPYKNKFLELEGFTNCTAIENGWCWNIPLWSRLGTGYVYSSKYVSDEDALKEFKNYLKSPLKVLPLNDEDIESLQFKKIKMRVGIHERTFVKNVVAIGLSAGFIEPLESNGLFSVHEFLFKLIDVLQRGDISQFDRDMYNVSVKDLFDNFAKFVSLHYALSHREDTKYWRDISQRAFSDDIGDPYFPYLGRSDAYFDIIDRYMNNWVYNTKPGGIPYIATGMNLITMNNSRYELINYYSKYNIKEETDSQIKIWESRKIKWNSNAQKSQDIYSYLYENFYKE